MRRGAGARLVAWADLAAASGVADVDFYRIALPRRATLAQNATVLAALVGRSGSMTVTCDGGYGDLAGKPVALEPATGFSFDSPMVPRPRSVCSRPGSGDQAGCRRSGTGEKSQETAHFSGRPATPSAPRFLRSVLKNTSVRLVTVVRATPELDVGDRRVTAAGVRHDVVVLEEGALAAVTAADADERAPASVPDQRRRA